MTPLLVACLIGIHSCFLWARFTFFRIDGPTHLGVRVIEVMGTVSVLTGAWLIFARTGPNAWTDFVALVMTAVSGGLFAWATRTVRRQQLTAAFSLDPPIELVTTGAFRWVRNPFYASYLLAHAIPVPASRSPWSLLPLAWMTLIYLRAALLEERKFLASPLAEDYRRYRRHTGRFLPRPFVLLER